LLRGLFAGSRYVDGKPRRPGVGQNHRVRSQGSVNTEPFSINSDGAITGWYYVAENDYGHGFLRSPDGTIMTFKARCDVARQGIQVNVT
jgi:hypothetical protein